MKKASIIVLLVVFFSTQIIAQETCFPTFTRVTKQVNGKWGIYTSDGILLYDFGTSKANADQGAYVLFYYRTSKICFTGGKFPNLPFAFFKNSNGTVPNTAVPGEDAIKFDYSNITAKQVNGTWKVVEGNSHYLFSFGNTQYDADMAANAVSIIKRYHFKYVCYVGRPNAPMVYLRQ